MQSNWFVIHTLSGQEQKVKENIEKRLKTEEMGDYIKEVLVPMEKVAEVRGGKKTVSTRKLYPGYVFVDMALLDENKRIIEKPWYFIRETPGIIGFVGGDRPTATSPEEIATILVDREKSKPVRKLELYSQDGRLLAASDTVLKPRPTGKRSRLTASR